MLHATGRLSWDLDVKPGGRWDMSPFAGSTSNRVWTTTDFSAFIRPGQDYTPVQAGFRLAFELPDCTRLTVGTSSVDHLEALASAMRLEVNDAAVDEYLEPITGSD